MAAAGNDFLDGGPGGFDNLFGEEGNDHADAGDQ